MKTFVFHPEKIDVSRLFADMEDVIFVPVGEDGELLTDVSLKAGDTFYIAGKKALKRNPGTTRKGLFRRLSSIKRPDDWRRGYHFNRNGKDT